MIGAITMLVTKRQLLAETAKRLGNDFTINTVKKVYDTISYLVQEHLQQADESEPVKVKLGSGLSITASIKEQENDYNRMWLKAKISRYHNRVNLNDLSY